MTNKEIKNKILAVEHANYHQYDNFDPPPTARDFANLHGTIQILIEQIKFLTTREKALTSSVQFLITELSKIHDDE